MVEIEPGIPLAGESATSGILALRATEDETGIEPPEEEEVDFLTSHGLGRAAIDI